MSQPVYYEDLGPPEEVKYLENFLKYYVKGQEKAISTVCKYYGYSRTLAHLEGRSGPVMVLLFLGPSGVGKTEMARALARYFHRSESAMIKIDCSQLKERHQVASLIGSPPGYIGYGDQAMLSEENIKKSKQGKQALPKEESATEDALDEANRLKEDELAEIFIEKIELKEEIERIRNDWRIDQGLLNTLRTLMAMLYEAERNARSNDEAEKLKIQAKKIIEYINQLQDSTILLINQLLKCRERLEKLAIQERQYNQDSIKEYKDRKKDVIQKKLAPTAEYPAIILFDEVEKAHEATHDFLLHIMEDARIAMSNGKISDLRNSIVILTSNVGSREITKKLKDRGAIGFHTNTNAKADLDVYEIAKTELEKRFKTEFLNRIDSIVVFRHLSEEDFMEILNKEIALFRKALKPLNAGLEISLEVRQKIIQASTDRPEAGARLLQHKFESMIKFPLGNILAGLKEKFTWNIIAEYDREEEKVKFKFSEVSLIEPPKQ